MRVSDLRTCRYGSPLIFEIDERDYDAIAAIVLEEMTLAGCDYLTLGRTVRRRIAQAAAWTIATGRGDAGCRQMVRKLIEQTRAGQP